MVGLEEMSREELLALVLAQARTIEALTQRVAELERERDCGFVELVADVDHLAGNAARVGRGTRIQAWQQPPCAHVDHGQSAASQDQPELAEADGQQCEQRCV